VPKRKNRRIQPASAYVAVVSVAGLAVTAYVAATEGSEIAARASLVYWLFGACIVIGELFPIRVRRPGAEGEVTPSTTFAFALLLVAGVPGAILGQVAATLLAQLISRKSPSKIAFNAAQYGLSIGASGLVLSWLTGVPHPGAHPFEPSDLPGILVAAAVFFIVNSLLVVRVVALLERTSVWSYFSSDLLFQVSTAGLLLGLSPIVVLAAQFSVALLPLLALPMISIHEGQRQALLNEHQALHDALTGLPNRLLLRDRIEQAIRVAERDATPLAVMLMDLDHFKEINDTLGHHHGDLLLGEVGKRLCETLRNSDTVARLGGDEFAILLPGAPNHALGASLAEKVSTALKRPFDVGGLGLEVGVSIGVAFYPEHGEDVDTLIQRADIAMYVAKETRSGYEVFTPKQDKYSPRRLQLASELRQAIENHELIPHYQPKVDMATGVVHGLEALMRWQHPTKGLIHPAEFIPIAEHTGLISPATVHILDASLRQCREWRDTGLDVTVAVNLSARSLLDTRLPERIGELLEAARVPAAALELEITESMIMADPARAAVILSRLSAMGVSLAIDDFGTGYSSLAHLKRLPVDEIKIDKSFVLNMASDKSDAVIVRSTIELARNLGLRVVAEGVESEQVWNQLLEFECDLAQGFYLSRPMPPGDVARWVQETARATGAAAGQPRPLSWPALSGGSNAA
jgi:diguanylate cyclase (GGDEF)-like protein